MMQIAVHFKYNDIALGRMKKFIGKRNMKWAPAKKQWIVDEIHWNDFLESLYDAPLEWRQYGYKAGEIVEAMQILREAEIEQIN
jgi:hypothetical protein